MNIIGIDIAKGCDYTGVTFGNGSEVKVIPNNNGVRGLRSKIKTVDDYCDCEWDILQDICKRAIGRYKYKKRMKNTNKLYNKLKKLGRRL